MFGKLIAKLDKHLRSQPSRENRNGSQIDLDSVLDVLALESRILYSAVPMIEATAAAVDGGVDTNAINQLFVGDTDSGANSTTPAIPSVDPEDVTTTPDAVTVETEDDPESSHETLVWDGQQSVTEPTQELIFIDTNVENFEQLLSEIASLSDDSRSIEIIFLDPTRDGIEQISQTLEGRYGVDAIHLVSHGSQGSVRLGNTHLTSENLGAYSDQIAGWSGSLDSNADLLIYGCELAGNADGRELIESIATLTQADVAASEDLTGHVDQGGDWDLEFDVGVVESKVVFSEIVQANWHGILANNTAPSFDVGDGHTITQVGANWDGANGVAIQADGKIVAVGGVNISGADSEMTVVRYNADGTLDASFGSSGIAITALGNGDDGAYAVAIQADGKILVAGTKSTGSNSDFAVLRYNSNGTLDTSFGISGIATTSFGSGNEVVYGIALQADGKIVLAGYTTLSGNEDFAVARFNTNGTLDTSFDGDGKNTTAIGSGSDRARGIAIQADGAIVLSGSTDNGTDTDIAVVRYTSSGALDTSFDTDGIITAAIGGGWESGTAVAMQADGKILIAADNGTGATSEFAVLRFNTNGSLDTSFSGDGIATTAIGGQYDNTHGIAIQADGKIVVIGDAFNGSNNDIAIVRFNTNGTLDTSFDTDGKITTAIGSGTDSGTAVAIQTDGQIIAAGNATIVSGDMIVLRYNSDGSLDTRFSLTNTLDGNPTYIEGGAAVVLDSNVQIFDAELSALDFSGATLTLARNGGAISQDEFSATGTLSLLAGNVIVGGVTIGTYTNSGGTLAIAFNGNATSTRVNAAMQQIAYSNTSSTPPATADIAWNFNDGNAGAQGTGGPLSTNGNVIVSITPVNSAPIELLSFQGIPESNLIGVYGFSNSSNFGRDDAGGNASMTLNGNPSQTTGPGGSQALDLAGGLSGQYGDIAGITTGGPITIAGWVKFDTTGYFERVFDFGQANASGIGNISLSRAGSTNDLRFSLEKNGIYGYHAIATNVITNGTWMHVATTIDAVGNMDLYVNGVSVASATGVAPDVGVRTNNFIGQSNWAADTLLDGAVDDFIIANGVLSATSIAALYQQSNGFAVVENAVNGTVVGTVVAMDPDPSDTYTYTLLDNAGGRFAINDTDGTIRVANGSLLDFESNASHSITVVVTDQNGLAYNEVFTVNLTNVNDAPTTMNLAGDSVGYNAGAGAIVIEQGNDAIVFDIDSANFDTGNLTVSIRSGGSAAEDVLAIRNQGVSAGLIGVSGSNVTYSGVLIGTVSGGGSGSDLVISLNANASSTAVTALVKNITFQNTNASSPVTGSREICFGINDGDGATSLQYSATVNLLGSNTATILDRWGNVAYSNNDGTQNWSNSWQELGESNGPNSGFVEIDSSNHAIEVGSGSTLLLFSTDISGRGLQRTADLSTAMSATLTLDAWRAGVTSSGSLILSISTDGTNWTNLDTYNSGSTTTSRSTFTYDISAYASATTSIRLLGSGTVGGVLTAGYYYADNIKIDYVYNTAPVLTLPGTQINYTENDTATLIDATATVMDLESTNFSGGQLTVDFALGGAAEDRLAIRNQGVGPGQIGVSGNLVTYAGVTIGSFAGGTDGSVPLVVTFNANATPNIVEATTRNITYANVSEDPSTITRQVRFQVTDGDGGTSSAVTENIFVTKVNDAPVALQDAHTAIEASGTNNGTPGTTTTGNVLANDTDFDFGDTKAVSGVSAGIVGSANGSVATSVTGNYGSINIAADGSYTYFIDNTNSAVQGLRTTLDTLADVFTYTMQDGNGLKSTTQITITVQGANDTPVAILDNAMAVEAGGTNNGTAGTNPTGNVLTNDNDVDASGNGETKSVTGVAAGTQISATGSVATNVAGNYGSIVIAANGSYTYAVDNNNATVQALRSPSNSLNDVFTYTFQDTAGATSTAQITITIQGANDAPNDLATAGLSVSENAANSTSAGTITHSDIDTSDTAVFSLVNDAGGRFAINATTGEITVADGSLLDSEAASSHNITVRVTDLFGAFYDEIFSVSLIDQNEFSVGLIADSNAATNLVSENAANGTAVGVTAIAIDSDTTNNTITYSLDDSAGGRFAIDASTGIVTVADGSLLNYEAATSHSITVRATSADGSTTAQNFLVSLSDVNESAVGALSDIDAASDFVLENANLGTAIGITGLATDSDGTDTVTYSLDSDAGGRFAIDANTGVVTVNGAIDREASASYDITIRATSTDTSVSTQVYTISIGDVNEYSTTGVIDTDGSINSVSENAANGIAVGTTAWASDSDATANAIVYSLDSSAGGKFSIDATTGVVTVADGTLIDFETASSLDIVVRATSADGTSSTQLFTISVTNVNEAPITAPETATTSAGVTITSSISINVLANDQDVDGDVLSALLVTGPISGNLILNSNGTWTYVPTPGFFGTVSFTYVATDGTLTSAIETVTIVVSGALAPTDATTNHTDAPGNSIADNSTGHNDDTLLTNNDRDPGSGNDKKTQSTDGLERAPAKTKSIRSTRSSGLNALQSFDSDNDSGISNSLDVEISEEALASMNYAVFATDVFEAEHLGSTNFLYDAQGMERTLTQFEQSTEVRDATNQWVAGAATSLFVGTTAGVAIWCTSGSYLASMVAASLPVWSSFDPILIVHDPSRQREEDDVSVAKIISERATSAKAKAT